MCHGCWGYIFLSLCPVMGVGGIFLSLGPVKGVGVQLVAISFWAQYALIICSLASRAPPPMTELGFPCGVEVTME